MGNVTILLKYILGFKKGKTGLNRNALLRVKTILFRRIAVDTTKFKDDPSKESEDNCYT